jgi:hypothetical protein
VVVLDNLREGVLTADIYDPTLNPLYRDVLQHYGAVPLPCRVADPDRKGKVESGVGHAQKTPLKGLRFESLEEAQTYLDHWEARWADTRIHGTTKRQVAVMFAEEKPALLPLPVEPFRYYQYGERTVHLDGCVEVEAAYYGAPPGWISRRVQVQWDARQNERERWEEIGTCHSEGPPADSRLIKSAYVIGCMLADLSHRGSTLGTGPSSGFSIAHRRRCRHRFCSIPGSLNFRHPIVR